MSDEPIEVVVESAPAAEPVPRPAAPLVLVIETRPQDWAPFAREILRQRGAWRSR